MPPENVLAHSDVAPERKIDPGEKFDWAWLAQQGVGHWVPPVPLDPADAGARTNTAGASVAEAQRLLGLYGYGISASGRLDERTAIVLKAFQRHFRPARIDGSLDRSTIETLKLLVAAL